MVFSRFLVMVCLVCAIGHCTQFALICIKAATPISVFLEHCGTTACSKWRLVPLDLVKSESASS
jgi:hypothetical protein